LVQAIDRFLSLARERTASGDPGPFRCLPFNDAGEFETAAAAAPHHHRAAPLPPTSPSPRGIAYVLAIDSVRISYYSCETAVEVESEADPDLLTVRYMISGTSTSSVGETIVAQARAGDCVFRVARGPIIRMSTSENFVCIVVAVSIPAKRRFSIAAQDDSERQARQYLENGFLVISQSKLWEMHLAYALDHTLERSVAGGDAASNGEVLGEFLYLLGCQKLAAQVKLGKKDPQRGIVPLKLKIAENFVIANAARALSIEEIATEARLSVRNLHTLFVKFRGMSPGAFIREQRLTGIRAALLDAQSGATVSDIASAWNYQNFGNFAAAYKKRFGELPSQTLDRRIAPSGVRVATSMRSYRV